MSHGPCPSRDRLLAYALGKLPQQEFESVSRHVAACPECESTVAGLDSAEDTLLAGLRERQPAPDPVVAEPELKQAADAVRKLGQPGATASTAPLDPARRPARTSLGQYRLLSRLGQGGMGTVYKALHTDLQKLVALKVLSPHLVQDRQAVARFRREMKALGRLEHPNLVRAMDAGQAEGRHFLVMEYVEGPSLAQLVRRLGRLPVPEACELIRQAAAGLQYAHEQGMVHRDVKPSNLLLTREGKVKVLDLGLALLASEETTRAKATDSGMALGTADYIAPEQVNDSHTVDIRADIYSLGCTLYELLTGRAPFAGPEYGTRLQRLMAHVNQPVPPARQFRPELPRDLLTTLECMLSKAPEDRYCQPREVAEALRPFCAEARPARLLDQRAAGPAPSTPSAPPPLPTGGATMNATNPGWYLAGAGNQRQGPFTTEQIIQAWQEGRVPEETPCTRPGMSGWMPLYQLEPFATVIRGSSVHAKKRGGLGRVVVVLLCAGCLGALGFFGWKEYERRFGPLVAAGNGGGAGPASEITPAAWKTPEQALTVIHSETTVSTRVELCQTFLQQFPQSPQAPEVMTIAVRDAPEAFQGAEEPDEAVVGRVTTMAQELIDKHAKQEGASQAVFKLVNWLEKEAKYEQAAKTAERLQQQFRKGEAELEPDAAIDLPKIVDRCWDQHIDKKLKVVTMDSPNMVYALAADPRRCHVVQVASACKRATFQTEELEILKDWVRRGGILWVDNDVLSVFGLSYYGAHPSRYRGWPNTVCSATTTGDICPILQGCSKVLIPPVGEGFGHLSGDGQVVHLLTSEGTNHWSLARYGRGWISDVKPVDTSSYDGARFWRNFRRFCLGDMPAWIDVSKPEPKSDSPRAATKTQDRNDTYESQSPPKPTVDIVPPPGAATGCSGGTIESTKAEPVAPSPAVPEPSQEPTVVASKQQLGEALAASDTAVLWVQLTAAETSKTDLAALRGWVEQGGVLWLDSDLAKEFGFPLASAPGEENSGKAQVPPNGHVVTKDLTPGSPVLFTLGEDRQLITGRTDELQKVMAPLLGWDASRTRVWVVCAVRALDQGWVVFRPRQFSPHDDPSRQFADNLRAWSFSVARPEP